MNMTSKPKVFVMIPPPIFSEDCEVSEAIAGDNSYTASKRDRTNLLFPKIIPEIAKEAGLPPQNVIDLHTPFARVIDKHNWKKNDLVCAQDNICDGVHLTYKGAEMAAHIIKDKAFKNIPTQ